MNNDYAVKELAAQIAARINSECNSPLQCSDFARKLFDEIANQLLQDCGTTRKIESPNVVLEVKDKDSDFLYRRYLELSYEENDNGLRIIGEDISGSPVQIVFLSNSALEKMNDLRGMGADNPRCSQ